eukprot:5612864-Amphidinium_carterae.1
MSRYKIVYCLEPGRNLSPEPHGHCVTIRSHRVRANCTMYFVHKCGHMFRHATVQGPSEKQAVTIVYSPRFAEVGQSCIVKCNDVKT